MKFLSLILGMIVATLLLPISFAEDTELPPQVHDLFNWYTSNQISYDTFKKILLILIEDDIFQTTQQTTENTDMKIKFIENLPYNMTNKIQNAEVKFIGLIIQVKDN